jgi:predicted nucleic acid-binding protein
MSLHVLDSSCWIEFFKGSTLGGWVRETINKNETQLLVPTLSLYEVHRVLSKQNLTDAQMQQVMGVMQRGQVIELTATRALAASNTASQYKLAMADAVMYSTALEFGATFWTFNVDYKSLPKVKYKAKG